jgi:hypothetical protein
MQWILFNSLIRAHFLKLYSRDIPYRGTKKLVYSKIKLYRQELYKEAPKGDQEIGLQRKRKG